MTTQAEGSQTLPSMQMHSVESDLINYNIYAQVLRFAFAGAITSQLAALLMASFLMLVFSAVYSHGPLYFFQVVGSIVYGEAAVDGFHIGAVFIGLFIHFIVVSLPWGLLFGVLAARVRITRVSQCISLGVLIGISSMLIDSYLVAPPILKSLYGTDIWNREMPNLSTWIGHFIFGFGFGAFPSVLHFLVHGRKLRPADV